MKCLLVYYSHYGNTAILAQKFERYLEKKYTVQLCELQYLRGSMGLFERTLFRFFPRFVNLDKPIVDLHDYDCLCMGVPVWGGRPSAPVARYVQLIRNLSGKKIILFYVFGIDASARSCAAHLHKIFKHKGAGQISDVFIPWKDAQHELIVDDLMAKSLDGIL